MTAGTMMAMAGAPVQAAEGEKDIVVAQADGNVSQDSVDRANELLNAMPEKVLEGFCDNGWKFYVTDKNLANTTRINIHTSGIYMVVVTANNTNTAQKIIIK